MMMRSLKTTVIIGWLTLLFNIVTAQDVFANNNLELYLSKAIEAENLRKIPFAIKLFRKILESTKDKELRMKIYFHMADCYYTIYIAAYNLYQEGLKNPKAEEYLILHPKTYLNLANILFNYTKYEKAASIYLKIAKRYKNRSFAPFAFVKAGDSFLNLKQYEKALQIYSKVILLYKKTREYWISRFRMADISIAKPNINVPQTIEYKDYREPMKTYKEIMKEAPEDLIKLKQLAQLRIASIYIKEKKYLAAIDTIKSFIKIYRDSRLNNYAKRLLSKSASLLINKLYQKKDYIRICKVYESIKDELNLSKLNTQIVEKIGDAFYKLDLYNDALKIYTISPKKNLKKIALVYNQTGRYKELISLLMPISKDLAPDMLIILAKALYKEKRFNKVINLLKERADKSFNPEAYYLLANSYNEIGDREKAIYYYQVLSKRKSEYQLDACLCLANLLFDLKRYKNALSYYLKAQKLCKRCPDTDIIRLQIANCYYELGDYKRSASILKQVNGDGIIRLVSNIQLEIIQLENTYRELRWLIE